MILSTATNIFYERSDNSRISLAQCLETCAKAGFRYFDFGFIELYKSSGAFRGENWKKEIEEYIRIAGNLGLTFVQGHGVIYNFTVRDGSAEEHYEQLRRNIEAASMMNIPWLVLHPSTEIIDGRVSSGTHQKNVDFFRETAAYAEQFHVGIAIENMWGKTKEGIPHYAVTAAELKQLILDTGRPNVGACWDVEHASIENLDQGASIRDLGSLIKAVHISDETGPNNIHILPYTGFVKWDEVLRAFAAIDFPGPFSFEIQHYLPGFPLELIHDAMKLSIRTGEHMIGEIEKFKLRG